MMNPHYPPIGQNNNTPNNPLGFPPTQDFNGHQNANMFGQPPIGPAAQMMPSTDVTQKMQQMNINGPQGFAPSQLPPGQLPPGPNAQSFGQGPSPGQRPIGSFPPGPPGPQGPPQQARQPQMPPSSASGPQGFSPMPQQSQTPNSSEPQQSRPFLPPSQGPPSQTMPPTSMQQGPPSSQPSQQPLGPGFQGQPGQMPVNQQPMGRTPQPGMPPSSVPTQPMVPKAGQMPPQPNLQPGQMVMPPSSQFNQMPSAPQPGMPSHGQLRQGPGGPPTSQFNQPGMPPMPPSSQPQFNHNQAPDQFNQGPPKGQFGQQPGGLPQQPGNQFPQQSQQLPGLPFMPPPLSQRMPPAPGSQPGYGKPPAPQGFPGMPAMPGQPPMQGQQPMPGQPPMPGQQPYPGQPPMPGQQPYPGQPPMQQNYPGQPPMPGQPPSGYPPQYQPAPFPAQQPSYPGQQYPGQQYQQPQKKLDPDQMPSPIQVMADDQQNRGGIFVTNEKGLVPPLVTTDFIVDDKGNASPRYIRSSMYSVPVTADLLKQTSMPFCLVIAPMAETVGSEPEPPLLDFAALTGSGGAGPVRCARCKAYMCPNMKFVDAGRHFKCAFCKATTEVPMEYTQYINSMQQYGRVPAEMALGTYEIVATKEYCRNNTLPNPPAIVFVIDVSYNSIKNGLLRTVCDNVMNIIEAMPKDETTGKSWTRVGFITYSSTVHFYNIKGTLAQPQMLSVGDVGDMFVPLLEGFLERPEDSGPVLQALLQQLPEMFQNNKETEVILLPAVQAGLEALKAADTAGQLFVFHTSLPSHPAPGRLLNREDRKLLGTDKEKQILSPQTTEYNELGQSLSAAGVSVEMFVCNNSYVDVATIGQLARLTGGFVHKYTYFTAELDGARLARDAARAATRPSAHDAVMRVRTSTGVRPTDFYGHFFMSNTTDIELAAIDADKAIGIEIKHDDKLTAEDGVYIQAALLYTHRSGQRRLRVINLALNVAQQLADVYRSVDTDTLVNFLTKQAVWVLREHTPRQVREALTQRCAKSLAAYRRHCASPSSPGQLVLPESMKLLPLYTCCVLRGDAVAGGPDMTCDDRSCAGLRALAADVAASCVYTYPRLLPLTSLPAPPRALPTLRASADRLSDDGVYLLENGVHMLLWVGSQAPAEWVRDVLGVASPQHVDSRTGELPELDNPLSASARAVIEDARSRRRCAMRLTIMRQHDKLETVLRHFLVEDRGVDGSASYVDFLCHIHKEIRALL